MTENRNDVEELRAARRLISDARDWALISFSVASLGVIFTFWALSAHQHNMDEASLGPITFSLALLQTILAVMAFSGFWLLKGAAVRAGEEAGKKAGQQAGSDETKLFLKSEEFENVLKGELGTPDSQAFIREIVEDWLDNKSGGTPPEPPVDDSDNIANSLEGGENDT